MKVSHFGLLPVHAAFGTPANLLRALCRWAALPPVEQGHSACVLSRARSTFAVPHEDCGENTRSMLVLLPSQQSCCSAACVDRGICTAPSRTLQHLCCTTILPAFDARHCARYDTRRRCLRLWPASRSPGACASPATLELEAVKPHGRAAGARMPFFTVFVRDW